MFQRHLIIALLVSLILSVPVLAKKPWRLNTTAVPTQMTNLAVGPYKCEIWLGGTTGGLSNGRPSPGYVDSALVKVRSPQGVQGKVNINRVDLLPGIAKTVNLKGGPKQDGRTLTVYIKKIKNHFATLEILVDDRADGSLDERRVIDTVLIGSRYLNGIFRIGKFAIRMGVGGNRGKDNKGNVTGRITDLNISFETNGFSKTFRFPKMMLFEGAVQNVTLDTKQGRYSAEVELIGIGPGLATVQMTLSNAD